MTELQKYERYKRQPWAFLTECCFTLDQVNKAEPIKTMPDRRYGKIYASLWQTCPLMAIPKSRRMTMSWYTIALYVHDTIFNTGRFNAFISKKEDDAHELVSRAKFIVDHIPHDKLHPDFIPPYEDKFCVLNFPTINSKIQGFPQGADQLRQFTFSGIFGDESAFWDKPQEFYAASLPTLDGGGRMTLVSSPAPGFFKKLCYDALDAQSEINVDSYRPMATELMQGVRLWKNVRNKFVIFELHYTADPNKRDPVYKESIKMSMPLMEYLREYELHWDTFDGYPVFPEFHKAHITKVKPTVTQGLPMLVGIDFGLTPAAIIAQYVEDQLFVFEELVEVNMGAVRFADKLSTHIKLKYPTHSDLRKNWLCYIDPAGLQRAQTDESTCAQALSNVGFVPAPGPVVWEERRRAVISFLRMLTPKGPSLQLYSADAPMLAKGFEGGYRFPDKAGDIEPNKLRPLKDAYSHPADAFQYLCSGVRSLSEKLKHQIPRPRYSLNERHIKNG